MSFAYTLVGYDRRTERMAPRHKVSTAALPAAKRLAGIDQVDDSEFGDCELQPSQARDIAGLIDISIDTTRYDYFLEPDVLVD